MATIQESREEETRNTIDRPAKDKIREQRQQHRCWKDIPTPLGVPAILDATYQLIVQRFTYPLELLFNRRG